MLISFRQLSAILQYLLHNSNSRYFIIKAVHKGIYNISTVGIAAGHLSTPDNKVHGVNMGPIWGRQGPGGPHVGPMNFAIWDHCILLKSIVAVLIPNYI